MFLAFLSIGCAHSADQSRVEIRQVLDSQVEAWCAGDIDGFMQGYWNSDELEFKSPAGTTRGWRATRERYLVKYDTREKMGRLEFADLRIDVKSPNEAFVRGRYILHRESGPTDTGRFDLIFRRIHEEWKIVRDETVGES